jgi:quercetin dioxygenase-like cupin family protein
VTAPGRHEDERGVIQDLLTEQIDGVTEIFSRAGAVRGNHTHNRTRQWTYVVSGKLRTVLGAAESIRGPGDFFLEPPGIPHAWEALEDTTVLVLTAGPRTGEGYESDTVRLDQPLITRTRM